MSKITFKCPKCGHDKFEVSSKDPRRSDKVKCAKCGYTETFEKFTTAQAKKHAEEVVKKAFKGLK